MPRMRRPSALAAGLFGLALLLVLAFAVGESMGWPWLVPPLQNYLSQRLERAVQLDQPDSQAGSPRARVHFWGGLSLQTPWLQVASPPWSQSPYLVTARDVEVQLRYADVWHAWHGQRLVVRALKASWLDAVLERSADGKTSWQGPQSSTPAEAPQVQAIEVPMGNVRYSDAQNGLEIDAKGTLAGQRLALQAKAKAGPARLSFDGHADDIAHWDRAQGKITVEGPSLAAVGKPLGITLPTTAAFRAQGQLAHGDKLWDLALDSAHIGNSQIAGKFRFDTQGAIPLLSGTLTGTQLNLVDLGPAVGVEKQGHAGDKDKVLPTRPFDLASLRVMDADVRIALSSVDFNTTVLEPLRPFNAQLQLAQGVLMLKDIDARTSQGHMRGTLSLNGQQDRAHWVAALQWDKVALAQWLHLQRSAGLPPYVSGELQGHANLVGDGRSTAEILATLQGQLQTTVEGGTISHLLIEMGGLDLAQGLGVWVKGDDALTLNCAVADLGVEHGVLRPRVLVLDTKDSTAWVDGTLSLATEALDLRAIVAPKDISPLTLRAPLHVQGTFAAPKVSVDKGPLGAKLGSALILGLINPLAALIPLVDTGSRDVAAQHASQCQAQLQKKLRPIRATP